MQRAAIREISEIRGKKRKSWYKLNLSIYLMNKIDKDFVYATDVLKCSHDVQFCLS